MSVFDRLIDAPAPQTRVDVAFNIQNVQLQMVAVNCGEVVRNRNCQNFYPQLSSLYPLIELRVPKSVHTHTQRASTRSENSKVGKWM